MRSLAAPSVCALLALAGCPSSRTDAPGPGGSAIASASAILPSPFSSSARGRSSLPENAIDEATAGVALRAGVGIPSDPGATGGEVVALRLDFSMRRQLIVPPAREPSFAGRAGALSIELADGRARVRLGPATFALPQGSELRLARGYVGELWVAQEGAPSSGYRVVPPGALRTFLTEGRADVVPFGPTRVLGSSPIELLGRTGERTVLTTPYGRVSLDQIPAPHPSARAQAVAPPSARSDAGRPPDAGVEPPPTLGLEGAGEPLCRALLELVASDRAFGGAPCDGERIPVRFEVAWAGGGGLLFEATAIREHAMARDDLAFPPVRARVGAAPAVGDGASFLVEPPRTDSAPLELVDGALVPRVAIVDGALVGWIAPGRSLTVAVARGKRHVEWQSLLGEAAEVALDAEPPARVTAGQALPAPLPSASAMASVRVHP